MKHWQCEVDNINYAGFIPRGDAIVDDKGKAYCNSRNIKLSHHSNKLFSTEGYSIGLLSVTVSVNKNGEKK